MSEIFPKGWVSASLDELATFSGGGTPSKSNPAFWMDGTVPWVSPKDMKTDVISDAEDHITEEAIGSSPAKLLPEGTVLVVTRSGILSNTLPVAVTSEKVTVNQDVKALVPFSGINSRYLALALKRYESSILRDCSKAGTTVPSILTPRLQAFRIPLAPSAEQVRIVAAIDDAKARIESARGSIEATPELLRQYREAILSAAFSGDASRAWREENPDAALQTQPERDLKSTWRETSGGERGATRDAASWFGVPEHVPWQFWPLSEIAEADCPISYGIIQTGDFTEGGVPTVRAGDIKKFRIDISQLKRVRSELASQYPRTQLRGGEVLISIRGTTGNVAVAPPEMAGMNVSREVAVIAVRQGINPHFVAYALASPSGQELIRRQVKGVAQSGINLADLRRFPMPLTSESEQAEIVAFIEDALSLIETLEDRCAEAARTLTNLSSAVLAKAFRGELTAQSDDDEPASVLLARCRAAVLAELRKPRLRQRADPSTREKAPKKLVMSKIRKDIEANHLLKIVESTKGKSIPVRELYLRSEMSVEEFYKQLSLELSSSPLIQSADKSRLEVKHAS